MHLTTEEEKILEGEHGMALQEALKMLVNLGEYNKAERLIPVDDVHVAGISYGTIGEFGLRWLEHLQSIGARRKKDLKATTNPAGMDLINFEKMGISRDSDFYEKQMRIIDCLIDMDLEPTWSCSAQLHADLPYKTDVAVAESHLSCFVNSRGIRTNRESGPSALYSAISGKTPEYGYHLDENRVPTIAIEVEGEFDEDSSVASALGYWIGRELRRDAEHGIVVPYIRGDVSWLNEFYQQESLAAGLASNSKINCFHIEDITREAIEEKFDVPEEKITFTNKELADTYTLLSDPIRDVDVIFIGCPHLPHNELEEVCSTFNPKRGIIKPDKKCWLFTGWDVCQNSKNNSTSYKNDVSYHKNDVSYHKNDVSYHKNDVSYPEIFYDTCLVVAPLKQMGIRSFATNSAKAAHYGRTVHGLQTYFTDLPGLLKIAKDWKVPRINKPSNLTLYKGELEKPKGRPYLCPEENKVVDLDIYGSSTESTAFGAVGICPNCKGFVFKI